MQFAGGVAGQSAALLSTLLIQILQVPILISSLGASGYGTYLVVIAVPSLVTMTDLGLLSATSTAMLQAASMGRVREARNLSQLTSGILLILASIVLVIVGTFALVIGALDSGLPSWAAPVFFLYGVYALMSIQTNAQEGILRADGRQLFGWTYVAALRLVEFLVGATALFLTGSVIWFVAAMLISRILGSVTLGILTARMAKWSSRKPSLRGWAGYRHLARPMAGSMSQPVANYLYLQGTVLIVGAALGPIAVAQVSIARTLVNLMKQASQVFILASIPVVTQALIRQDEGAYRTQLRRTVLAVAPVVGASWILLLIAGPSVIGWWSRNEVEVQLLLVVLLAIETTAEIALAIVSIRLIASNRHFGYSLLALAVAVIYVPVAVFASQTSLYAVLIAQACAMLVSILLAVTLTKRSKKGGR